MRSSMEKSHNDSRFKQQDKALQHHGSGASEPRFTMKKSRRQPVCHCPLARVGATVPLTSTCHPLARLGPLHSPSTCHPLARVGATAPPPSTCHPLGLGCGHTVLTEHLSSARDLLPLGSRDLVAALLGTQGSRPTEAT